MHIVLNLIIILRYKSKYSQTVIKLTVIPPMPQVRNSPSRFLHKGVIPVAMADPRRAAPITSFTLMLSIAGPEMRVPRKYPPCLQVNTAVMELVLVLVRCSRSMRLGPIRLLLRIDNCDERPDYKDGDISGLKGAIFINDISIESPEFSLLYGII